MKDAEPAPTPAEGGESAKTDAAATTAAAVEAATPSKSKDKSRRKSKGPSDGTKTLKKKASMARIVHPDVKPGDYYFVKLKSSSHWPSIIADETMLPQKLLDSRPVAAMRPDGSWREDFAEGGKNMHERAYPVMYLETNEL